MSRITLRKIKGIFFHWGLWLFASAFYSISRYFPELKNSIDWPLPLQVFFFGTAMGFFSGIYESYIIQDNKNNRGIWITLFSRLLYFSFSFFITSLVFAAVDQHGLPKDLKWSALWNHPEFLPAAVFMYIAMFSTTFIVYADKKFGHRILFNTLLGKYQKPTEETRIFMFVDLKSATTLAEKLGPEQYSLFLQEYFFFVSNVCAENDGEVYQYAGDGVLLTWTFDQCRTRPLVLQCYHDLEKCFIGAESRFRKKFGTIPRFKAAAHTGRVVATEVGNYGCDLAYHGDTLNTTSRLLSLCSLLQKDFIISELLYYKLPKDDSWNMQNCGHYSLKGKNREIVVYSATKN
jgi:adenylate cyclase